MELKDEKQIDFLEREVNNLVDYMDIDPIDDNSIDWIVSESPVYKELMKNEEELEDDFISEISNQIFEQITEMIKKKGLEARYDEKKKKYFYDRQMSAEKGYEELLDWLDKNDVDYEISRSTEAGYVPSIYIKDYLTNEVLLRIANHKNNNIDEFDYIYNDRYNKIFKDKNYIN